MTNRRRAATIGGIVLAAVALRRTLSRRTLTGKSVLITGGSRGLGLELARTFLERGCRVTVCGRDPAALRAAKEALDAPDGALLTIGCNITNAAEVAAMVQRHLEAWGGLDLLINNAAQFVTGPADATTPADYERMMEVNFWGTKRVTEAALPALLEARGKVVTVASAAGPLAVPYLSAYGSSKAAAARYAEALNVEYRPMGVSSLVVYPTFMGTDYAQVAAYRGPGQPAQQRVFHRLTRTPVVAVPPRRAARLIADACEGDRTKLVVGVSALLGTVVEPMLPEVFRTSASLANRWLRSLAKPSK